jgi:oxygen-independent coproporphyrinogen-3 oxidase
MSPVGLAPDSLVVEQAAQALEGVPRAAYSVPHVYPTAAPAYTKAPMAERPHLTADQLRLYMHLPYCRYRCTFCYFAVRVGAAHDDMARYVRTLRRELEWIEPGARLSQLYVGGGTPTALPPELLDEALSAAFERTTRDGEGVHTVETSPETISEAHLDVLRRHGIGRVSMGVQSLESDVLDAVHRDQTAEQALASCELLVSSGLIVNIDLIYGLPGQREESFLSDLATLARLGVPSFTLYSLRVTERTPVRRVLSEEERFDLARLMRWRAVVQRGAEDLGYTQTRWHTFKRLDTHAHRHDRLPCFDDSLSGFQLGVGMSARSHLGHTIYRNRDSIDVYQQRVDSGVSPVEEIFPMSEEDLMTQFVARSLGDGKPLVRADYERVFGRAIDDDFGEVLQRLKWASLVDDDGFLLTLSERGKLLYDLVTLAFYPARARAWLAGKESKAAFVQIGARDSST